MGGGLPRWVVSSPPASPQHLPSEGCMWEFPRKFGNDLEIQGLEVEKCVHPLDERSVVR
jgi:hypothetical protein